VVSAAVKRQMHGQRVLLALAALVVIEGAIAPGHDWLVGLIDGAISRWGTSAVQIWPMTAWKAVLESIGLTTSSSHGFGTVVALLIGLPLLVIGGVIVEAIWIVPYAIGAVIIGAGSVAVRLHLLPLLGGAVLACRLVPEWREYFFPRVGPAPHRPCVIIPRGESVPAPAETVPGPLPAAPSVAGARLCTMGPEWVHLADRRDAVTRNPFEPGERFILCGGSCGRPYKLVTCEFFEYRCPKDGSSLHPVEATPMSGPSA
jgi:hypothetical protein